MVRIAAFMSPSLIGNEPDVAMIGQNPAIHRPEAGVDEKNLDMMIKKPVPMLNTADYMTYSFNKMNGELEDLI